MSVALNKESIVMSAHKKNLHDGVASPMAEARSLFWITVLGKVTKSVLRNCYDFKQFRATNYPNTKPGLIPEYQFRSEYI